MGKWTISITLILFGLTKLVQNNSIVIDKIIENEHTRTKVVEAIRSTLNDEMAKAKLNESSFYSGSDQDVVHLIVDSLSSDFEQQALLGLYFIYRAPEHGIVLGVGHARCSLIFVASDIVDNQVPSSEVRIKEHECANE